jgi:hypothetical protein
MSLGLRRQVSTEKMRLISVSMRVNPDCINHVHGLVLLWSNSTHHSCNSLRNIKTIKPTTNHIHHELSDWRTKS